VGKRLSRFGVGPKIVASVLACAALAGALSYTFAAACVVPALHQSTVVTLAVILIVIGMPMWLIGAIAAMRAYNRDQLVTSGVFGLVRHPMYAAWIVLILPGIALLTGSWPYLLMPLVGYAVFKALIHTEDEYLQNRFGQSYSDYRASVNAIIPIPRMHHRAAAHR
jgi:protein-S-isoprenylcysteine O-methyltransferase Ste14